MKKIAIVMGHFGLKSGGGLSAVLNLVNFLSKNNYIHIYAGKENFQIPKNLKNKKNIKFTLFKISHKGFLKIPQYNFNFRDIENFDFVWFHGAYMGWNKIAKDLKNKYIYTPHGGFSNLINVDPFRLLRRTFLFFSEYFLIKNAILVQALSQSEYSFLKKINPNAKNIPNYIFKKKKIVYRSKKKSLCYIGRLDPSKNIPFLIKIVKKLNIVIDYYGYFTKSSSLKYKKNLKKNVSFSKNFYGSYKGQRELSKILQKYHFMLLPSKWEGMPIVIYEAIENGVIPVVSNEVKVPSFLKKFILLIDISDLDKATKLVKYLNSNYTKKHKLLIKNAILACQKNLNGGKYNSILDK